MKNFTHALGGLALITFAGWLLAQSGHTLLTQICVWLGLSMLLSLEYASPRLNRTFYFARIGLAFNVITFLSMVVLHRYLVSHDWHENALTVQFHTWAQWLATPVATGFDALVTKNNWGIYLFPEYSGLCLTLTFYGNLVVHLLLSILLLTALATFSSRERE